MSRTAKQREGLTHRDLRILHFVDRYRLATPALLTAALFAGAGDEEAATRTLRKLVKRGYLRRVDLCAGQFYVVLTRRGCRRIEAPDRVPRPLTEHSLPTALAIAWHCVRHGLTRMTDRQFRATYPELWRPGLRSSSYALDETPQGLGLVLFVVDRGGTARRLRNKIHRLVGQRRPLPAFACLLSARRFQIRVLTGTSRHEQDIRRQLKRIKILPVEVEVAVVPELAELFTLSR